MPQSPIDFEFHTWQGLDLASIPGLSPDERQAVLGRYVKLRDDLAVLLDNQREALAQAPPGYWQMRKLSQLVRQHRGAELAVERFLKTIAEAEAKELVSHG